MPDSQSVDADSAKVLISLFSQNSKESITLEVISSVPLNLSSVSSHLIHNYNYNPRPIFQINTNKERIFYSNNKTLIRRAQNTPLMVKLSFQLKDQYGILTHLKGNQFIISYVNSISKDKQQSNFTSKEYNSDIIKPWTSTISNSQKNSFKLSMKPPVQSSPNKVNQDSTITDPFDYFVDKYFDTLYQLTPSLTYFAKSAFSRLKALCSNMEPAISYESILNQFLLNFEQFDARHLISNNGILNSNTMFDVESPYRNTFISKSLNLVDFDIHSINYSDTNKSLVDLLNSFKLREIQIQIIILLELISITNRDDLKYFNEQKKSKPLTRRNLVGKRKVTPTITGSAISTEPSTEPSTNKSTNISNYNLLFDSFVDKLCIWEILNGSSSNKEHSSGKFISYVLIPYFDKRCPNSIKRIIKKVKGPSFRSSSSSSSSKTSKSDSNGLKRTTSASDLIQKETKKPSLTRSSSILEGLDELRPQRSNSDLEALKRVSSFNVSNLGKRQIDISKPIPNNSSSDKIASRSNSMNIFNRVGKKIASSSSMKLQADLAISQVEETPVKKQKIIDVLGTPDKSDNSKHSKKLDINSSSSPVNFLSTPANPALQSPLMIRSTIKSSGDNKMAQNEVRSPEDSRLKGSPKVRRKLFASR